MSAKRTSAKRRRRFTHNANFRELIEDIRADGYGVMAVATSLEYTSPHDEEEIHALKDELVDVIETLQESVRALKRSREFG